MKAYLEIENYWNHDFSNDISIFTHNNELEISLIYKYNNKYYVPCCIDRKKDYAVVKKIKLNKTGKEFDYENNIKCPYCEYEDFDSWEADDSSDENKCDGCGLSFSYTRHVEITYSSKPVKQKINITPIIEEKEDGKE